MPGGAAICDARTHAHQQPGGSNYHPVRCQVGCDVDIVERRQHDWHDGHGSQKGQTLSCSVAPAAINEPADDATCAHDAPVSQQVNCATQADQQTADQTPNPVRFHESFLDVFLPVAGCDG